MPPQSHIAQINIGRVHAQLDDPVMAGFVARLDEINALAESSPGFVWRLKTEEGDATYLRPYDDDRILLNMSVWEGAEQLKHFVYRSAHANVMRQRKSWFERFDDVYIALWHIDAGYIPTVEEAKERLQHLQLHGESEFAFSFAGLLSQPQAGTANSVQHQ